MSKHIYQKGFTLLELLVVLSIFVIMSSILVANQRQFGKNINLSNLAYDVSLSIREAQSYGFGVRSVDNQGGGSITYDDTSFKNPYGIHFELDKPTTYVLFADLDSTYTYTPADAVIKTYTLTTGITLKDLCSSQVPGSTTLVCGKVSNSAYPLDLVFKRPNPDARIVPNNDANPAQKYVKGAICLTNGSTYKQIDILTSGQIEVNDGCPSN